MRGNEAEEFAVVIEVKTCSAEPVGHLLKRFVTKSNCGFGDNLLVRDVAGVVTQVASGVTRFKPGDHVVGLLPITQQFNPAVTSQCTTQEYFLVLKPGTLPWEIATSCLMDGLKAYDALHYLARVRPGDTALICNANTSMGVACVQLASTWSVRVLATCASDDDAQMLRTMLHGGDHDHVIRVVAGHQYVRNTVVDETGGLGVDCVIDNGVLPNLTNTDEHDWSKPMKHDVISCLAVSGRWVTSQHDLQLDPPDSELLHLKNASVCHLFPDALVLSTYQQHRVLHVLQDVLEKADAGKFRPHMMRVIPASDVSAGLFPTNHRIVLKL